MYLLPVWGSFASYVFAALLGRHFGSRGVYILSVISIFICSVSSWCIFYEVCLCQSICRIKCAEWISFGTLRVDWGFLYDPLSASMLLVITTVSLCAHIYSIEYMSTDPHNIRFFSYLSLFTFFMIILVISDNAIQLFVGWEGVGICSYLLINFWYTRIQANKASILAVITNKIGDIALLVGIAVLYRSYHTVDFAVLNSCVMADSVVNVLYIPLGIELRVIEWYLGGNILRVPSGDSCVLADYYKFTNIMHDRDYENALHSACILLMIAAIGKSAQAGLHIWLPEAMEGPTPVSSLIHAATMVTAGVFILVRCAHLFEHAVYAHVLIIFVGSITAFFSSAIGLLQKDLKKVVAYSTCSQLGYMFVGCGFSAHNNSMHHLFNHAFFKALLFLTAGYIIHALSNEQDVRKMGSLLRILPYQYVLMTVGSLSLVGFPFMSGYYSKDKLIELCFNYYQRAPDFLLAYRYISIAQLLILLAVICTLVYSIRLLFYVFINSYNGFRMYIHSIHFSAACTQLPLLVLAVPSVLSGYCTSDMMVGVGSPFWLNSISHDTFIELNTPCNPYSKHAAAFEGKLEGSVCYCKLGDWATGVFWNSWTLGVWDWWMGNPKPNSVWFRDITGIHVYREMSIHNIKLIERYLKVDGDTLNVLRWYIHLYKTKTQITADAFGQYFFGKHADSTLRPPKNWSMLELHTFIKKYMWSPIGVHRIVEFLSGYSCEKTNLFTWDYPYFVGIGKTVCNLLNWLRVWIWLNFANDRSTYGFLKAFWGDNPMVRDAECYLSIEINAQFQKYLLQCIVDKIPLQTIRNGSLEVEALGIKELCKIWYEDDSYVKSDYAGSNTVFIIVAIIWAIFMALLAMS